MPRIPEDARCFACDYLLRDLSESRCPECGRSFDPATLATVNTTGRPLGWQRLLLRPPGMLLALMALPALITPVWYARNPGHQFDSGMALILFGVVAIAGWVIRFIAWATVRERFSCPDDLARPWHWRWFLCPLVLLAAWLIPLDSVTSFSFNCSRPALEEYAREVMGNPTAVWPPRRVGVLTVQVAEASSSMVRFYCGHGYDGARCGYIYSPVAAPTTSDDTGNIKFDPLGGPWYEYWDHTRGSLPSPAPTSAPATLPT